MAAYAFCHVLSALAPDFTALAVVRFLLAIPAAFFTPQAAATVGVLLPPARRASAITFIFIGWSMATVAGVPLGGYVAHLAGWRVAFLIVAVASAIAAILVWRTVPDGVKIAPLDSASWRRVFTSEALMTVLLVTVLNGTGQFTFFTYLAPSMKASLAAGAGLISLLLPWYGSFATIGNLIVTRAVGRTGAPRAALMTFVTMAAGMILWGVLAGSIPGVLCAATLWGLGTFAANSVQQARLASIAPELTSASISLNTSAIYFGQAAGAGIGAVMIGLGFLSDLPFVGAAIILAAASVSVVAQRWER
jgi:predicted MFS family arabinose efflux permease